MGDYNNALKEAEIVYSMKNNFDGYYTLMALIYELQGKYDDAVKVYQKAIELFDKNRHISQFASYYDNLAIIYHKKKDYKNASKAYLKAIKIYPNFAWIYGNYAATLIAMGDLDTAEKMAKKALNIMDYSMGHYYLYYIYTERGLKAEKLKQLKKAENQYLIALNEYKRDKFAYTRLGYIYKNRGEIEKAINMFKKILWIDEYDETANYALGFIYYSKRMFDEAEKCFQKYLKMQPTKTDVLNTMGVIWAERGKFGKARQYWEKTLGIDPNYFKAQKNLERIGRN